ncbi:MAG: nuclear transport factor 2 family protein [Edaphobacter sp.]|uniref:nuclear transport factor 2 family protein n=1 Tax=Edaphobacter sp. TaxID=1934404 RepID=UPI0023A28D67|nr:nuclear transport factor 2 family protein [Edaphobacter sp.]MDE1177115.1 nuclear transport factor 2 family protein [Edaphobacter sp.]
MKRLAGSLFFVFMILIGAASSTQSPLPADTNKAVPTSTASDTVDVQHVIDAYHEAVLTHDGSRLARLFFPQGGMWLNVLSDEAYARAKAKSPDAVKVRVGSYTDFAKLVSTSKASFNPTHTHLHENSDGTIASVYFDFVFLVDGKEQNRGSETWVVGQRKRGLEDSRNDLLVKSTRIMSARSA